MAFFKKYISPKQLHKFVTVWVLLFFAISIRAQFAPPAGHEGTTAIKADSSIFVNWADNCIVERGFINIEETDLGYANYGDDTLAIGIADNGVVSFGDGGFALMFFEIPIVNGPGFDFAIFENSFIDDFLELAFVEVSSDGQEFFRFPSTSNTQTNEQIETFGLIDATEINNLAGKYRGGFGTPFDLEELNMITELNINNIIAIKIIDVVGNIDEEFASYDSHENAINDPWPTPFGSSGFDLDALGIIHDKEHTDIQNLNEDECSVGPNPFSGLLKINNLEKDTEINIFDIYSRHIFNLKVDKNTSVTIKGDVLPKGMLLLLITKGNKTITRKVLHN